LELLQQGHNPGKYAQMLREILRKMSKDDANVRLRSLEQVLLLGQNIVQQDSEEKKKKAVNAGPGPVNSPSSVGGNISPNRQVISISPVAPNPAASKSRPVINTQLPPANLPISQQRSHSNPMGSRRSPTNNNSGPTHFASASSRNSPVYMTAEDLEKRPKVIARATRAPGLMPDNLEKKPKKVCVYESI
jgi:hypothetical protein